MPPLGSVGLTATKIALMLRKTDRVPVFVTGLDFSYRAGTTHARGSAPHTARLASSFRISPAANYEAAFGCSMQKIIGKDGSPFFTSPALLSYVQTFRAYFSESPNLFDAGTTGIELGIPQKDADDLIREIVNTVGAERDRRKKDANGAETIVGQKDSENYIARTGTDEKAVHAKKTFTERTAFSERKALSVRNFYEKEECALERLKNILSSGRNMSEDERRVEIEKLLAAREYLYLHFPDGLKASFDLSFLKRVRAEIDFFIKDIEVGKSILERD